MRKPRAVRSEGDLEEFCGNEPLNYAAEGAYERAGGKRDALERNSNEFEEPAGESIAEADLPRRFPTLGKRFAPATFAEG